MSDSRTKHNVPKEVLEQAPLDRIHDQAVVTGCNESYDHNILLVFRIGQKADKCVAFPCDLFVFSMKNEEIAKEIVDKLIKLQENQV